MASRTQNSIRNVFAAWGGQALLAVSQFVVRAVFVACLAQEYVGLETLFASVLTVLTLADLGVGSAIVFEQGGASFVVCLKDWESHEVELVENEVLCTYDFAPQQMSLL